jgi:putative transposase
VLTVLRYIERNPVRAGLTTRADAWAWSSAYARLHPPGKDQPAVPLAEPPGGLPENGATWMNRPQSSKELEALRRCVARGAPFGRVRHPAWQLKLAAAGGVLAPQGEPSRQGGCGRRRYLCCRKNGHGCGVCGRSVMESRKNS